METSELIRTLSSFWRILAIKSELTISANINQTLLDAAHGLCEITGLYYKPKNELLEDERIALLIVAQIEELVHERIGSD